MSAYMRDFMASGGWDGDETDDLGQDALNFFGNLPVIGGVVKGVQSVVAPQTLSAADQNKGLVGNIIGAVPGVGGTATQLLASLPMPPMPSLPMVGGAAGLPIPPIPQALIPAMGQAIGQATGITPAATGIGALLGAGLGGLPFGTGPFPGPLGNMMQQAFGQPGLPPAWSVPQQSVTNGDWRDAANHAERVGRAVVSRVTGTTQPQLDQIQHWLRQRAAQIQATAEHRLAMSDADFKAMVIELLLTMRRQLGLSGMGGAAPTMYNAGSTSVGVASKY